MLDGPSTPSIISRDDTLQRGVEFKMNLEKISSQLQTHADTDKAQPKRKNIEVVPEQAQLLEAPTKENPIPSLQIGKKEKALVQDIGNSFIFSSR